MSEAQQPPEDPLITVYVNGQPVRFPWRKTHHTLFKVLPLWLKDSAAPIPEPPPDAPFKIHPKMMDAARSGLKALVRPFLPMVLKGLYGPNAPTIGLKQDAMPVLIHAMIDFGLAQLRRHPVSVEYDETNGLVSSVRQRERDVSSADTGDETSQAGKHPQD